MKYLVARKAMVILFMAGCILSSCSVKKVAEEYAFSKREAVLEENNTPSDTEFEVGMPVEYALHPYVLLDNKTYYISDTVYECEASYEAIQKYGSLTLRVGGTDDTERKMATLDDPAHSAIYTICQDGPLVYFDGEWHLLQQSKTSADERTEYAKKMIKYWINGFDSEHKNEELYFTQGIHYVTENGNARVYYVFCNNKNIGMLTVGGCLNGELISQYLVGEDERITKLYQNGTPFYPYSSYGPYELAVTDEEVLRLKELTCSEALHVKLEPIILKLERLY